MVRDNEVMIWGKKIEHAIKMIEKEIFLGVSDTLFDEKLARIEHLENQECYRIWKQGKKKKRPIKKVLMLLMDSVYTNYIISFYEEYNGDTEIIFLISSANEVLEYVKEDFCRKENVLCINPNKEDEFKNHILWSDRVVIHYLFDEYCKLFYNLEYTGEISWILWGGDVYQFSSYPIYADKTRKFLGELDFDDEAYFHSLNYIYRKSMIREIDKFHMELEKDFEILKQDYKVLGNSEHYLMPFSSVKSSLKTVEATNLNKFYKKNHDFYCLVGNSGSFTNNHIDTFLNIKEIITAYPQYNIGFVLCLAYGGNSAYIKYLKTLNSQYFNNQLIMMEEYQEEEEFQAFVKGFDFAIMNHIRSQAVGTINLLIKNSIPVIFNKKSVVYDQYKKWGMKVIYDKFSPEILEGIEVSDLEHDINVLSRSLEDVKKHNYDLIE